MSQDKIEMINECIKSITDKGGVVFGKFFHNTGISPIPEPKTASERTTIDEPKTAGERTTASEQTTIDIAVNDEVFREIQKIPGNIVQTRSYGHNYRCYEFQLTQDDQVIAAIRLYSGISDILISDFDINMLTSEGIHLPSINYHFPRLLTSNNPDAERSSLLRRISHKEAIITNEYLHLLSQDTVIDSVCAKRDILALLKENWKISTVNERDLTEIFEITNEDSPWTRKCCKEYIEIYNILNSLLESGAIVYGEYVRENCVYSTDRIPKYIDIELDVINSSCIEKLEIEVGEPTTDYVFGKVQTFHKYQLRNNNVVITTFRFFQKIEIDDFDINQVYCDTFLPNWSSFSDLSTNFKTRRTTISTNCYSLLFVEESPAEQTRRSVIDLISDKWTILSPDGKNLAKILNIDNNVRQSWTKKVNMLEITKDLELLYLCVKSIIDNDGIISGEYVCQHLLSGEKKIGYLDVRFEVKSDLSFFLHYFKKKEVKLEKLNVRDISFSYQYVLKRGNSDICILRVRISKESISYPYNIYNVYTKDGSNVKVNKYYDREKVLDCINRKKVIISSYIDSSDLEKDVARFQKLGWTVYLDNDEGQPLVQLNMFEKNNNVLEEEDSDDANNSVESEEISDSIGTVSYPYEIYLSKIVLWWWLLLVIFGIYSSFCPDPNQMINNTVCDIDDYIMY